MKHEKTLSSTGLLHLFPRLRSNALKLTVYTALISATCIPADAQYKLLDNNIHTPWADKVTPGNVRPEYPRPMVKRLQWKSLNGLWNYAIIPVGKPRPAEMQGEILVPFCVESDLSGVGKRVGADNELWYERQFNVPSSWKGERIMLNFGAVDWKCSVWVNDILVGSHTGGYTPFSIDITDALASKGENTLTVKVWDPTELGYQPRGKQTSNNRGIWYTPVTGIWQTVWLEPVPEQHISNIHTVPDIDAGTLNVEIFSNRPLQGTIAEVSVTDNGRIIASGKSANGLPVEVRMPEGFKLWTPDSPNLYAVEVSISKDGKRLDKIDSYTAMRKFSTARDSKGITRMQLNNKDLFQFGPLDQGWWPDGLYTAPTHEAMVFDIDKTKELGFNMIRKHVKVEPATWYAHCDSIGMIVWQDMPSGDKSPEWQNHSYFNGTEKKRSPESEDNYRREWNEIMDCLYSHPSIAVWVPFNEAWGQFKTEEIADATKRHDPSRLVNPASGGNFYHCGDILDLHNYPAPELYLYDGERANVLGEYGGIGYAVDGHLWAPDRNWGYVKFDSPQAVTDEYVKYAGMLLDLVPAGFSAGVYTQTTDVELEVNGIYTYDRKVLKMLPERVKEANRLLTRSLSRE